MANSMETIHMEAIHKRHRFEVRRETRSGNTTATKRSTAMTTKLWVDTSMETPTKHGVTLHVVLARAPLVMAQECRWRYTRVTGTTIKGKQQIRHGHVDDEKVDWFSKSWRFVNNYSYQ